MPSAARSANKAFAAPGRRARIVLVGASSGGLAAVQRLLRGLDAAFALPVVVVQHLGQGDDVLTWTGLLAAASKLPVVEARHRAPVRAGVVQIAPAGYHLLIERTRTFALSAEEKVLHVRPSVDVLFHAAADVYRGGCVGVVLTGANDDGARGLEEIRSRGGIAIVQDPAEAEAPQMPAAALRQAGADYTLALAEIPGVLNRLAREAA